MQPTNVIDQFPFDFYGETFSAALADDRRLYIPLTDMCTALGIQTNGQIRRIRENEVLADALIPLTLSRSYNEESLQRQQVLCLWLERLPFWLGTIQPTRIADPERRAAVVRFQREFADVAWAAFRTEILPADILAEMDAVRPPEEQEYHQLMDTAATLRASLQSHDEQLDSLDSRLSDLEARLVGTDFINTSQMKEYMDMVGLVAFLLNKRKKGNQATVHAEIKRQFQVPSYQLIPEAEFDTVKQFLADWYRRLAPPGTALPAIFEAPSQKRLF